MTEPRNARMRLTRVWSRTAAVTCSRTSRMAARVSEVTNTSFARRPSPTSLSVSPRKSSSQLGSTSPTRPVAGNAATRLSGDVITDDVSRVLYTGTASRTVWMEVTRSLSTSTGTTSSLPPSPSSLLASVSLSFSTLHQRKEPALSLWTLWTVLLIIWTFLSN